MNQFARARTTTSTLITAALVAALTAGGTALLSVAPAAGAVTIDEPNTPPAGRVDLTGSVGVERGQTTSVLFVLDATRSTGELTGLDCSNDGVTGAVEDDLNGDGTRGDILDCEIAGVQSLRSSLASTSDLQVGLVAFANKAAAADLDPAGTATFLPPAFTGGDARARIDTVAGSIQRDRIGLYDVKELGGSGLGTAFIGAVATALDTLAAAPAGPKWVMFLSDGQAGIDDAALADLGASGVRWRSFAVGSGATCSPTGSLYKMAAVTGEACQAVGQPASLAAELSETQPDTISGVTVTIGNVAVAATVGAVGGWRAGFLLGAGTYTAKVRATLASGAVRTAERTFAVSSANASDVGPPDGSAAPVPGTLGATAVKVDRPAPSRAALPSRVTGRVGVPVDGLSTSRVLAGSRVHLQARARAGDDWTSVATSRVSREGRFALSWKPSLQLPLLRVALTPSGRLAGSAATVPEARVSACKVSRRTSGWSVTCQTTAKPGSIVRLLDGRTIDDRTTVRNGRFRLRGAGRVAGLMIEVELGARRHVRLTL